VTRVTPGVMEGTHMRTSIVSVLSAVALVGGLGIATTDVSPEVSDPSPVVEVEKTAPPTPPVIVPDTAVEVDQADVEVIPAPEPVMEQEPALAFGPGECAYDAMDGCEPMPEPVTVEQVLNYPRTSTDWREFQCIGDE